MKPSLTLRMILMLLVICAWRGLAYTQEEFAVTWYTTRDGLPHNDVRSIAQDSTGFLWIATWDGLSRYDGYEFRNYYHDPDDSTTIPYFSAEKVVVDRYNQVWVLTQGRSLARYDPAGDCFVREKMEKEIYLAQDLETDLSGELWQWNMLSGVERYNYATRSFERVETVLSQGDQNPLLGPRGCNMMFDNRGNLWFLVYTPVPAVLYKGILSDGNRLLLDTAPYSLHASFLQNLSNAPAIRPRIHISSAGDSYLLSNLGVLKMAHGSREWLPVVISREGGELSGASTPYWSPDHHSIRVADPALGRVKILKADGDHRITDIFRDRQGTLWFSSQKGSDEGNGLSRAIPISGFFRHHFTAEDQTGFTNAFFGILKDREGTLWGLPRNLPHLFRKEKERPVTPVNAIDADTRRQVRHARSLLEDPTGVWIGYYRDLLMRYDFGSRRFSRVIPGNGALHDAPAVSFKHLLPYGDKLLAAGDYGIYIVNPRTAEVIHALKEIETIYSIKRDNAGHFWIGSDMSNLTVCDSNLVIEKTYRVTPGLFNIEDLEFGDDGSLWLALLGGGLCHFLPSDGSSQAFTTADGLSNNTCYSILKDRSGNLWISTNQGISSFSPATGKFRIFGPGEGLRISEFNSDAAYLAPDGEMFFGGMGGAVSFYPDSAHLFLQENHQAPLVITGLRSEGVPLPTGHFRGVRDTVRLSRGNDNVEFSFACLDFPHSGKIRYRHRLNGAEDTWTETDHRRRFIHYSNLRPGEYRFDLEATNNNGDWAAATSLLIVIPRYFYQTVWARILGSLLLLMVPAYIFLNYTRKLRFRARRQQDQLRLESLRSQMNPHFIFNSLNSVNYFISQNDRLSANRYISGFAGLIRNILENLSSDYIPFARELDSLREYLDLEHLRFGDRFDYSLEVQEESEMAGILVFPGLVQPFLENAIWHGIRGLEGRKGTITLRFLHPREDEILCIIEDDGIGRTQAEAHKSPLPGKSSRGVAIVRERIATVNSLQNKNYRVTIEDLFPDSKETGTRVTLDIPVKNQSTRQTADLSS